MTGLLSWCKSHRATVTLALVALTVGLVLALHHVSPDLPDAQRATAGTLKNYDADKVRTGAYLDYAFMVAYSALGWALFSLIRSPHDKGQRHPAAWAGTFLVLGAAAADAVENLFLFRALGHAAKKAGSDLGTMRAAGMVKWSLLLAAAVTLATLCLLRSWRPRLKVGRPTDRPVPQPLVAEHHQWEPPPVEGAPRIGVCLSGGGIRAAAFSLGGLQALRAKGRLDKANYLTAASGGGYLAAGWALSDAGPPGDLDANPNSAPRWDPGSPEERWFRDHASYLIPDLKGGLTGLFRLLAGVVINVLVIALVLFAASRPVGWTLHALHPRLRATDPTVLIRDTAGDMKVSAIRRLGTVDTGGNQGTITRFAVTLAPDVTVKDAKDPPPNEACFDLWPYKPKQRDVCVGVVQEESRPGVVEVQNGRAKVVTQPRVKVAYPDPDPNPACGATCLTVRKAALIQKQPGLGLEDDLVVDGEQPTLRQFKVEHQPKVSIKTGLAAMRYPQYRWWMWELVGGLLAAGLLVALAVMTVRLRGQRAEVARSLARALAGTGLLAFIVIVGLPWLVVWLPATLSAAANAGTKSASGSGIQDYLVPSGGLLAVVAAAARQFLAGSEGKTGAGTGPSLPWYRRAWNALTKRSAQLKWYESSPSKILLFIISAAAMTVVFVNALQFATANGTHGRLMGFAFVRDFLPGWAFAPDWWKLVAVVVGLALFGWAADAQSWSLYPFYKARLSSAFLLRRIDAHHAEPVPYDELIPFHEHMKKPGEGMQLVACCSVNLSDYGAVPPGRRAASFTFSSTEIGGPLVGYATPEEYWNLPLSRRRDVTLPSAMAISGAAFSPAMGKFNLGPIGGLLALANLRLGVWIPHPRRVRDCGPSEWTWWRLRRPHWVWFLRELTNKYAFNRRYLYVSDGGHWDNLGLVELLRRGCTEIYCISGAGDGAVSFGTIGEAIALAREELGVEIDLDPSPLRSATKAPTPAPDRELRREGSKDKASVYAAAAAKKGTFRYTRNPGAAPGVIYYVEADLTADMPFDVHSFAEAESPFPDDSTGDQVFNHRQFESYRALGYHQAIKAVELP